MTGILVYQPDECQSPVDVLLVAHSVPEPEFDAVTRDFLLHSYRDCMARLAKGESLVEVVSLARRAPWLFRLSFRTRGLARDAAGDVRPWDEHTIALRFLPDYLRRAQQFEMLHYVGPREPAPFHPNICPATGAVCLEIYPGEELLEIVYSLHDLLRWRLRQFAETDALNRDACSYGRNLVTEPTDDRPLLGRRFRLEFLEAAR
jgi:hypothetical protein